MKFKTAKVLSGTLNSDSEKTAPDLLMPPAPKNIFGQTIVHGRAAKYLIVKSIKSMSVLNLI